MVKRLLVVVVLGGLGVVVWMKKDGIETAEVKLAEAPPPVDAQAPYFDPDVEGVEPDGAPEFNVVHDLHMVGKRNVMSFIVTETHGWYADHIYVTFWYEEEDEDGKRQRLGDPIEFLMKGYIDFGKTLEDETTLLSYEFPELDGFGTTDDWQVIVSQSGQVFAPKPS